MPYKIAIASGKGGTGKTTVSINLFKHLSEILSEQIQLVDCDVEEPNDLLFFNNSKLIEEHEIFQSIPAINTEKCNFCRKCSEYCEFNAIVVLPSIPFAEVNSTLCHSCGACLIACENNAILEHPVSIGTINLYKTENDKDVMEGRLKVGSAMQTLLIKELKKRVAETNDIVIYDAPPGTSCSVVQTITDTNYVILVAEPTLFGVHDLELMVNLVKELEIPFGVVINKAGLGSNSIYEYLKNEGIDILGEIPFSKEYASIYAEGKIIDIIPDTIRDSYLGIQKKLYQNIVQYEGDNYFKW